MLRKKIRLKLSGEKVIVSITGNDAKQALGRLYEKLVKPDEEKNFGLAAIEMFLELFGVNTTEKLLRFCEKEPHKTAKKLKSVIRYVIYPLCVKQQKINDRQRVRKYL